MNLYDFLSQNCCYLCGCPLPADRALCESCIRRISGTDLGLSRCPRCSYPFFQDEGECAFCHLLPPELESLHALNFFRAVHKELIHLYKAGKLKNLRYFYAEKIHRELQGWEKGEKMLIVPVPPRRGKLRRQGWDQISLLSATLKSLYGYRIAPVLRRSDSIQQKSLSLEERRNHLVNSLGMQRNASKKLEGAEILVLLDDVFTSGATLSACASLLKGCSSLPVRAVVLCGVL